MIGVYVYRHRYGPAPTFTETSCTEIMSATAVCVQRLKRASSSTAVKHDNSPVIPMRSTEGRYVGCSSSYYRVACNLQVPAVLYFDHVNVVSVQSRTSACNNDNHLYFRPPETDTNITSPSHFVPSGVGTNEAENARRRPGGSCVIARVARVPRLSL